jgi:hypothetical protein
MYIPRLGDKLTLTSDWTFLMHNERRNLWFFKVNGKDPDREWYAYCRGNRAMSDNWAEFEGEMDETLKQDIIETAPDIFRKAYSPTNSETIEQRMSHRTDQKFISKVYLREDKSPWGSNFIKRIYMVKYLYRLVADDFKYTFPAGTILLVKRIYIRRGSPEYDSVSFSAQNGPAKGKTFWANLDDVNYMEFK